MRLMMLAAFFVAFPSAAAQTKPSPDVADVVYGPHPRNVLDLWKAKSGTPTPLVVFFHGGGFLRGSKEQLNPSLLQALLAEGISVAAVNYRLTDAAPFPGPMRDGGRAVQFLRSRAMEWNLDPRRFGAVGGSAGAGIALWLAFHDDLAERDSSDPVLRESTRLQVVAANEAQTSYDPRWIKAKIGVRAEDHPFFAPFYGLLPADLGSARAHRLYAEASPMTYLSADDPPVFMYYSIAPREPVPPDATEHGMHHITFGLVLKQKMDSLGIEIVVRHRAEYEAKGSQRPDPQTERVAFLARRLRSSPK